MVSHTVRVLLVHFQPYNTHPHTPPVFFLEMFPQPHVPRTVPGRWLSLCPMCKTLHVSLVKLIPLF